MRELICLDVGLAIAVRYTRPGLAQVGIPLFYRRVCKAQGVPRVWDGQEDFKNGGASV
jgi:hypothetical protein